MNAERQPPTPENEEVWQQVLSGGHPAYRWGRNVFRRLPSLPRCKLCAAPFAGSGGTLMRLIGKRPWPKNPKYCNWCLSDLEKHPGGAEIECTLLFADVRGSTALAEQMTPTEFRALMDRFYAVATEVLIDHDGFVDKFVGDEVIGMFIPMLTGEAHASSALAAARVLMTELAEIDSDVLVKIGVGVHTGVSFVGTVGTEQDLEFTALGDTVNTAARLAAAAAGDEILISLPAAEAAGVATTGLERRDLQLKGKSETVPVLVLAAEPSFSL